MNIIKRFFYRLWDVDLNLDESLGINWFDKKRIKRLEAFIKLLEMKKKKTISDKPIFEKVNRLETIYIDLLNYYKTQDAKFAQELRKELPILNISEINKNAQKLKPLLDQLKHIHRKINNKIITQEKYDDIFPKKINTDIKKLKPTTENEKKRIETVLNDPKSQHIQVLGHDLIVSKPSYSKNYANCNGAILLSDKIETGFMHDAYPNNERVDYLTDLIDKHKLNKFPGIYAILLGGEPTHFWNNVEILKKQGIPIKSAFLDSWGHFEEKKSRKNGTSKYLKDLVVFPTTKEVFIRCREPTNPEKDLYGWRKLN